MNKMERLGKWKNIKGECFEKKQSSYHVISHFSISFSTIKLFVNFSFQDMVKHDIDETKKKMSVFLLNVLTKFEVYRLIHKKT